MVVTGLSAKKGKTKTFPVVEIFGPTVQGEGPHQGTPCLFVRFGGCDYACSWCDTPHAVIPAEVRKAQKMTNDEIHDALAALHGPPYYVVLSGGNPALQELSGLCSVLGQAGYTLSLETQGTRWKPWIDAIDHVCVSPKPPSSGMVTNWQTLDSFVAHLSGLEDFLKVVVFDLEDFEYAAKVHQRYPHIPFYVSAGNDAGRTVGHPDRDDPRPLRAVREDLLEQSDWLVDQVLNDDRFRDVRVQSQYHVLLWGNVQGV